MSAAESSAILFPRCLYGTKQVTRAASRKMCRQAWREGTWESVFAGLEMVPFQENAGWIVLTHGWSRLPEPRLRWNLNWTSEDLMNLAGKDQDWEKQHALNIEGMNSLWYAVAMLGHRPGFCNNGNENANEWYRTMVQCYVHWLPEFCMLADYFVPDELANNRELFTCDWASVILWCTHQLGTTIPLGQITDGDIVTALLDLSVVERDGDRYRSII